MKINSKIIAVVFLLVAVSSFASQPDKDSSTCAATPEQLYKKAELVALLQPAKTTSTLNLNSMMGVWEVIFPLRRDKIAMTMKRDRFVVQIKDIVRDASICVDENRAGWLRIVVHSPRCPENKNIYVKVIEPNLIEIEAYQTRLVGSANFRRISPSPVLNIKPQARPPCARNWRG